MKVIIAALCVLSVTGAYAQAQFSTTPPSTTPPSIAPSSITLYGTFDEYLGYIHSNSGRSIVGLNDGALLRSRLGVRGIEDLGGGLRAKYNLEQGINADTGSQADASRLFDRQAWVGIESSIGEFRFGRQNTELFYVGGAIDYTDRATFGSISNNVGVPTRYDNDISYKSPRIANFQASAHYALKETGTEMSGRRGVYQFALDYSNGPYRFGYAGLASKPAATATIDRQVQSHNLYADYDYGAGKVYLSYGRTNNVTANANGNTAGAILNNVSIPNNSFPGTDPNVNRFFDIYQISVDYRVTPLLRIGALWGTIKDQSGSDAGANGGSFGGFYDLSKRTTLYSFANWMKNQSNAGYRFSGSGAPSANLAGADINGKLLTGFQAGILHRF
jgi:predicted porin